jgi:hypothetical protein
MTQHIQNGNNHSCRNEWKRSINDSIASMTHNRTGILVILDGVDMCTTKALIAHDIEPNRIIVPEHIECIHGAHVRMCNDLKQSPVLINACVTDITNCINAIDTVKVCVAYFDLMGNAENAFDTFSQCVCDLKHSMSDNSIIAVTFAAHTLTGLTVANLETMCMSVCDKTYTNVQQGWTPFYEIDSCNSGILHIQFHINRSESIEPTYTLSKIPVRVDVSGSKIVSETPHMVSIINPKKLYTLCKYAGFPACPAEWHANDNLSFA